MRKQLAYYRRRVLGNWRDMLTIGILPIASVGFLGYIAIKSILTAPAAQNYSLLGFEVVGFILILVARFWWKSEFFGIRLESGSPGEDWHQISGSRRAVAALPPRPGCGSAGTALAMSA